jgi:hypothetical protein
MTYQTGVVVLFSSLDMALSAVIHLHPIPGIPLVSGDISPPDIDTVMCEPVNLVDRRGFSCGKISMADPASNLGHPYMGDVWKIHTVWLP